MPYSIDVEALFARCMGNESFGKTLLTELEETGIHHVETIEQLLDKADFRALAKSARFLQDAAEILAVGVIRETAERIEDACVTLRHAELAPLVQRLHHEMERCLAEIPTVRQRFRELAQDTLPL